MDIALQNIWKHSPELEILHVDVSDNSQHLLKFQGVNLYHSSTKFMRR